jgi:hypothetical protein
MVNSAGRVVRIRTTQDHYGRVCGIVTGTGATPQDALDELRNEASKLAQQAGQERNEPLEEAAAARARRAAEEAAQKAQQEARRPVKSRWESGPPGGRRRPAEPSSGSGAREWRFEVVDVRLTPAVLEGRTIVWLAYGTLAWEPEASTTRKTSGSYGGIPGRPPWAPTHE